MQDVTKFFNTQAAANVIAIVAAAIAIAAFWAARRTNNAARVELVTDVRREWEEHRHDWATCLLLYNGADDYYVDASIEQRERVHALLANIEGNPTGLTANINAVRAETRTVRRVMRFLAYCGRLVLSNRLSCDDIYNILGPDVARHGKAIRWLCGSATMRESMPYMDSDTEWSHMADQITEWSYFNEQEVILALIDILWSQVSKNGDFGPDSLIRVAQHKRTTKSGLDGRRRIRRLARPRSGILHAWRLSRELKYSERLPFDSVFAGNRRHVEQIDPIYLRRTLGSSFLTRRRIERALELQRQASDDD
ncbi:hypothetical protein ACQP2P_38700 [Dactylosporangium sp. CA-139114]|uniref:hypothetical protein n=1 Tax=Dactylosporangium sp. CA-139114 TaxID=3239931 RepID=UPI003D991AA4